MSDTLRAGAILLENRILDLDTKKKQNLLRISTMEIKIWPKATSVTTKILLGKRSSRTCSSCLKVISHQAQHPHHLWGFVALSEGRLSLVYRLWHSPQSANLHTTHLFRPTQSHIIHITALNVQLKILYRWDHCYILECIPCLLSKFTTVARVLMRPLLQ